MLEMCESSKFRKEKMKRRREERKKGPNHEKTVMTQDQTSDNDPRNEKKPANFIFLRRDVPSRIENRPKMKMKKKMRETCPLHGKRFPRETLDHSILPSYDSRF